MTLTVDVWGLTTDESSSEASNAPYGQNMLHSTSSIDSNASAPPLPRTMPPTNRPDSPSHDSFYLPSHQGEDSADEASEIEDDGPTPLRTIPRAKSAERDSDFSEGSFLQNARRSKGKGKNLRVVAGSLESIPDSGMGSLRQDEVVKMMKDRIKELENKLKVSVISNMAFCIQILCKCLWLYKNIMYLLAKAGLPSYFVNAACLAFYLYVITICVITQYYNSVPCWILN